MEDVGDGTDAESRTQFIGISSDLGQTTSIETPNGSSGLLFGSNLRSFGPYDSSKAVINKFMVKYDIFYSFLRRYVYISNNKINFQRGTSGEAIDILLY